MPCSSGSYLAWLKILSPGTKAGLLEQIFLQGQIYRVTNDDGGLLPYHLWTVDMPSSWAERNIHVGQKDPCKKGRFLCNSPRGTEDASKHTLTAQERWYMKERHKIFSSTFDDSLWVCACLSVFWMQICLEKHDAALQRRKHDRSARWLSRERHLLPSLNFNSWDAQGRGRRQFLQDTFWPSHALYGTHT